MESILNIHDLSRMSRDELYKLAQRFNVKGRSKLTKSELIERLTPLLSRDAKKMAPSGPIASKKSPEHRSKKKQPSKSSAVKLGKKGYGNETSELDLQTKHSGTEKPQSIENLETRAYSPSLSSESLHVSENIAAEELPLGYGDTKIVLQIRDPHWAHAYWEIAERTRQQLRHTIGDETYEHSLFVLRVYDVTGIEFDGHNAHSSYDIHIFEGANSWYLNLGRPNCSFVVDLGIVTPSGEFVIIARSNVVNTPRDTYSETIDDHWMVPDEEFREIYRASGGLNIGMSSGEARNELGRRLLEQLSSAALSSGALSSANFSSETLSAEAAGLQNVRRFSNKEKDFWLVVNTELVVYGATEPNATVTVQGRKVTLRPDGTFSVRFALPDGHQEIPVRAVNDDCDMEKSVTPVVDKLTR